MSQSHSGILRIKGGIGTNKHAISVLQRSQILEYLKNSCNGRSNAVTSKWLSRNFFITDRCVRDIVHDLRKEGYPIASAVHKPYGFFIPETREEVNECTAQIKSRIREMSSMCQALEKSFMDIDSKQMKI